MKPENVTYEAPMATVVDLNMESHLLVGSDLATKDPYEPINW